MGTATSPDAIDTIVDAYLGLLEPYDPTKVGLFDTSAEPFDAEDDDSILPPHLAMLDDEEALEASGSQRSAFDHGPTGRL